MMRYLAPDCWVSAGSWGNTGQPGPTALELPVTQDPALCVHPDMHVTLFSDSKSNSKIEEPEVQLSSTLRSLTIHSPTWQPISLKEEPCQKVLFCVAPHESPATANIRCCWQYPALFSSPSHRRSRKKWLREVSYIGLLNELGKFLRAVRGAGGTHIYQDNETLL